LGGVPAEVLLQLPECVEVLGGPDEVEGGPHLCLVAAGEGFAHAVDEPAASFGVANVRERRGRAVDECIAEGDEPGA
jgi:hypothetical protein